MDTSQNLSSGTDSPSIIDLIKDDHSRIRSLWQQYQSQGATNEMKQQLAWHIIRELAIHSAAEEEVMYPEVRKHIGSEAADELLGGHQRLKDLLYQLNGMSVDKQGVAAVDGKVAEAMKELDSHIDEEEGKFWPQMCRLVDTDHLMKLGGQFIAAKKHAVTRPHPWAPNKPPLNVAANMMTAPLDSAADMWRFGGNPNPAMP